MNVMKVTITFLGHLYYLLSLCDLSLGVEPSFIKEIMHFHRVTYMATPYHKNNCSGGHGIYNFSRSLLRHHTYIPICKCLIIARRTELLNKYINFKLVTSELSPLWLERHEIYACLSPYPKDACLYKQNLVKIGPVVLDRNLFTHNGRRRTPIHGNRPPEWLRWFKNDETTLLIYISSVWCMYRQVIYLQKYGWNLFHSWDVIF